MYSSFTFAQPPHLSAQFFKFRQLPRRAQHFSLQMLAQIFCRRELSFRRTDGRACGAGIHRDQVAHGLVRTSRLWDPPPACLATGDTVGWSPHNKALALPRMRQWHRQTAPDLSTNRLFGKDQPIGKRGFMSSHACTNPARGSPRRRGSAPCRCPVRTARCGGRNRSAPAAQ